MYRGLHAGRYYHKHTYVFMSSTHYRCQILMRLEFSVQIFKISSNIKFHKNLSNRSRTVPRGQVERQTVREI